MNLTSIDQTEMSKVNGGDNITRWFFRMLGGVKAAFESAREVMRNMEPGQANHWPDEIGKIE